jgi:selenocysteine-specific elongation factor
LLELCEQDGLLVRISDGLLLTPESLERATRLCRQLLTEAPATISQLREAWGVSRKYAVPLSEYFDQHGITRRQGDLRVLGPHASRSKPA